MPKPMPEACVFLVYYVIKPRLFDSWLDMFEKGVYTHEMAYFIGKIMMHLH